MSAKKIRIYVGVNQGLPNLSRSLSYLIHRISSSGIPTENLCVVDAAPTEFEYPTLNRLWADSQKEDFYGLYLHCKGASKSDEPEFQNGLSWMHYMAYGVLDNYQLCNLHMDRGADLVGSMWYRHFKGNFFWFKSSYVRNLVGPYNLGIDLTNRYPAEYWCSQAYFYPNAVLYPKVKNLFYLPVKEDHDFLSLYSQGYLPDMRSRTSCSDLPAKKAENYFAIYDDITVSKQDLGLVDAFSNYNSEIYLCPPPKQP